MSDFKETPSFLVADRRINALLHKLNARGVCGCCTSRALLYHGATLMEETAGSAEAVAVCESIIDRLRKNDVPGPDHSEITH